MLDNVTDIVAKQTIALFAPSAQAMSFAVVPKPVVNQQDGVDGSQYNESLARRSYGTCRGPPLLDQLIKVEGKQFETYGDKRKLLKQIAKQEPTKQVTMPLSRNLYLRLPNTRPVATVHWLSQTGRPRIG